MDGTQSFLRLPYIQNWRIRLEHGAVSCKKLISSSGYDNAHGGPPAGLHNLAQCTIDSVYRIRIEVPHQT
eukprot:3445233-Amphidinium_carterae.1